jgi:hypothetical protein
MTAGTQSKTHESANAQELSRVRALRTVAIAIAVVAFATLVYGFGMKWAAMYQVAAGLAAYIGVEWQRQIGKKIKQLGGS